MILDTLLRSNHLSVETVHPLLSFQLLTFSDGTPLPAMTKITARCAACANIPKRGVDSSRLESSSCSIGPRDRLLRRNHGRHRYTFGVTLVGIILIIDGILALIAAVIALLGIGDGFTTAILAALLAGVIGLIYLAVAKGIFDGNNGSRLIVAIVTIINIIVGVFQFLSGGIVHILFGIIVLILLYSPKAKAYFG